MLRKKYRSIMQKPEEERNRWALGLTVTFSVLIFAGFAFYKGYLGFGGNAVFGGQTASVVSAEAVPSPVQNTKDTFEAAFGEIGKQYREFKDSVSSVLVPFITGIEVYKRDTK